MTLKQFEQIFHKDEMKPTNCKCCCKFTFYFIWTILLYGLQWFLHAVLVLSSLRRNYTSNSNVNFTQQKPIKRHLLHNFIVCFGPWNDSHRENFMKSRRSHAMNNFSFPQIALCIRLNLISIGNFFSRSKRKLIPISQSKGKMISFDVQGSTQLRFRTSIKFSIITISERKTIKFKAQHVEEFLSGKALGNLENKQRANHHLANNLICYDLKI